MTPEILHARKQLIIGDISHVPEKYHRILSFDPTELYSRLEPLIKPYKRSQNISIIDLFPDNNGYCACGCGVKLQGRRTRWATEKCNVFPLQVFWVIKGDTKVIGNILWRLYGWECCVCGREGGDIKRPNDRDMRTSIEIEHTLPVKHGGGGSWLSNYTLMCFECHRLKTNKDFGYKQPKHHEVAEPKNNFEKWTHGLDWGEETLLEQRERLVKKILSPKELEEREKLVKKEPKQLNLFD